MKRTLLLLVIIFFWFLPPVQAEMKTFVHTVRQPFSGSQSPDDARVAATHKAKREVLEKAGTYLETLTIVEKGRLTKDQVLALASGVLKTEIVSQKNYMAGEGFGIIIKARVKIDTSVLEERVKKLMADRTAMEQLAASRKKEKELLDKIDSLEEEQVLVKIERLKEKHSGSGKTRTTQIRKKEILKKQFRQATQGLTALKWYDKATLLWDGVNGKYTDPDKALEYLNKAISLDSNYVYAYINRSIAYTDLGKYEQALEDLNNVFAMGDPFLFHIVFYNRAQIFKELGKYQIALEAFNQAIIFGGGYRTYNERGCLYVDLASLDKAIEDFNESIHLNPNFAKAYNNRGLAYKKLGQHQRAIKNFSQAISLSPNYYLSHINRGLIYLGLGQYQQAIEDYNKAIRLDPNNPAAYVCRGVTYRILEKPDLACKDLEQACNLGDCEQLNWAKDGGLCQ